MSGFPPISPTYPRWPIRETAPARRATTVEELAAIPVHSVLVDSLGAAWQVQRRGRAAYLMSAGSDCLFVPSALADVLPMRVVDDGHPEA